MDQNPYVTPPTEAAQTAQQAAAQPEGTPASAPVQSEGIPASAPVQSGAPIYQQIPTTVRVAPKPPTEYSIRMKENFSFFGPAFLALAVLYAFCTHKNPSGVAFVLFMAGCFVVLVQSFKVLQIELQKSACFYFTGMGLLSISMFLTDDQRILVFNKIGILLLMMSLLISHFYATEKWDLGKWIGSILASVFTALEDLGVPFETLSNHIKSGKAKNKKAWYVVLGLLISLPLVAIVLALLGSADFVFREMVDKVLKNINFENIFGVLLRIAFMFFAGYCLLSRLCKKDLDENVKDHRTAEPVIAITVSAVLTLIYLVFSFVQIFYLFLGNLQLPEGYTYAEYAREGFFELLAVGILNLVIVLVMLAFFRESKVLKGILTLMCVCTYIMIASSAMRMVLYITYYQLTFLRILVLWTLLLLTVLFTGIIISIFRSEFPLFRFSCVVMTVLYIALSFSHPDYIIAKVNTSGVSGRVDQSYLVQELSADAYPILIPYLEKTGYYGQADGKAIEDVLWNFPEEKMNPRTFNLSRYLAQQCVNK